MDAGDFLIVAGEGEVDGSPRHRAEDRRGLRGELLAQHQRQARRDAGDDALHGLAGDRQLRGQKAQIGPVVLGHRPGGGEDAQRLHPHLVAFGIEPVLGRDLEDRAQQHRHRQRQFDHRARQARHAARRPRHGRGQPVEPVAPVADIAPRLRGRVEGAVQRHQGDPVQPLAHEARQPVDQPLRAAADRGQHLHDQPAGVVVAARQLVDLDMDRRVIDRRQNGLP